MVALLAVLVPGVSGCTAGASDPFQLRVGECLPTADTSGLVEEIETVDCAEPHAAEVFHSIAVQESGSDYPGKEELQRQAGGCAAFFKGFVGKPYDESDLEITYFHPTPESWKQGDRQILCIVAVPTGTVTGSLKGSSR